MNKKPFSPTTVKQSPAPAGSISITRSISSVNVLLAIFRESEDVLEVTLKESGDAER